MDKHIGCDEAAGLLALYHYGELDAAAAGAVEAHIAGCAACRAELAGLSRTLSLVVADMPSGAQTQASKAVVMRRIGDGRKSTFSRFAPPALAAAAFAAIAALVLNYTGVLAPRAVPPEGAPVNAAFSAAVEWELLDNYELVANMDMLEEMDTLEHMKDM